ncbi:MAG: hypothetical protein WBD20_19895 [Pirellulaceae bacterium]
MNNMQTDLKDAVATQMRLFTKANRVLAIVVLLVIALNPKVADAGISGENIMVVVNADSLGSRTVANFYAELRKIPDNNIILLRDVPDGLTVSLHDFKSKILKPVLETIQNRGLAPQTRCIAYSAGFPTSVDIQSHYDRLPSAEVKKLIGTLGSITGMTYFYRYVLADGEGYLGFASNQYARGKFDRYFANPFRTEHKAEFDQAKVDLEGDDPAKAAKTFRDLFQQYPTLAPLAILSAKGYSKAGEPAEATKMARAGIKAGWWSADYLTDDPSLKPLLSDPAIQQLLPFLSKHAMHVQGPKAFSATMGWTDNGYPVRIDQGGVPLIMCCALAIVHPNGNTLGEAIAILQRAAGADRTYPDGIFQFAGNGDVRATTRAPGVGDALLYLQTDGFQTDIFRSTLPTKPDDVAGLFLGTAVANFQDTKWRLQPGAIAETLTSTAGDFRETSQTKLTEYLKAGAAMSSGTVAEPYSLQHKFPLAMMHGYYASGVSAIEAYYLSVLSPYQLLLAGDPACQPYARPPASNVEISLTPGETTQVRFVRTQLPLEKMEKHSTPAADWEIYVEGRLVNKIPAAQNVNMNLTGGLSGVIDVRGVLVGYNESEPRLSFGAMIQLDGDLPAPTSTLLLGRRKADDPIDNGATSKDITIQLDCAGADRIEVMHHSEVVGTLEGASGAVVVKANTLGGGPLRLRPVASFGDKRILGDYVK